MAASSSDFQRYIDMWKNISRRSQDDNRDDVAAAADQIPPKTPRSLDMETLPPFEIPAKNPRRMQKRGSTGNALDGGFILQPNAVVDQRPLVEQIRSSFEYWSPPPPSRGDNDDFDFDLPTHEQEETSVSDSRPSSPGYAATFRSIALGNPFDAETATLRRATSFASTHYSPSEYPYEGCKAHEACESRETGVEIESQPFTPDELWNFHQQHQPSSCRPLPPPSPPTTISSRHAKSHARCFSAASPHTSSGRESLSRGYASPQDHRDFIRPGAQPIHPPSSAGRYHHGHHAYGYNSDIAYEQQGQMGIGGGYRAASPESYAASIHSIHSIPECPSSAVDSGSSGSRRSRRSKTSSILSVTGDAISEKAAKMLGIKLQTNETENWAPTTPHAHTINGRYSHDIQDRYNFHRQRQNSSYSQHATGYVNGHNRSVSLPVYNGGVPISPLSPPPYDPRLSHSPLNFPYDPTFDATRLWKALKKGRKTDTNLLSDILLTASHEPIKLTLIKQKYHHLYSEDLEKDIRSETSGHYRTLLSRLIAGPIEAEAHALNKNDSTYFMDEKLISETLFGKTEEELEGIKKHFEQIHGLSLKTVLNNLYLFCPVSAGLVYSAAGTAGAFGKACLDAIDVKRDTETIATLAMMDGEKMKERDKQMSKDVQNLYRVKEGRKILNLTLLLQLVITRSDLYLGELARRFHEVHGKELPDLVTAKEKSRMVHGSYYPPSVAYAVLHALQGAINKPARDAKLLEDAMKGLGTRDARLIARIIRIHFDNDPRHMDYVREVYQQKYNRNLKDRIKDNTRGPYRDLLLKMIQGRGELMPGHMVWGGDLNFF
ncbi:hypothetical protein BZA77DRAFT_144276 [Pyronema omphalodes]|nr:hypothetical protein BZA77DRAFT_144276 [Pyronema omphalodes]